MITVLATTPRNEIEQGNRTIRKPLQESPPPMPRMYPLPRSLRYLRKSPGLHFPNGVVQVLERREEDAQEDGRIQVSFEQVQPVFKEIWDDLPVSEQLRLLLLINSPKEEPLRAATIVAKRGGKNGPDDTNNKKVTMAVAGRVR